MILSIFRTVTALAIASSIVRTADIASVFSVKESKANQITTLEFDGDSMFYGTDSSYEAYQLSTSSQTVTRKFYGHSNAVKSIHALDSAKEIIITGGADSKIIVHNTTSGKPIETYSLPNYNGIKKVWACSSLSNDYRYIYFIGSASTMLGRVDRFNNTISQSEGHIGSITSFSGEALSGGVCSRLFTASDRGEVVEWNLQNGALVATYSGVENAITSLVYDSTSSILVAGSSDGKVVKWNRGDGLPNETGSLSSSKAINALVIHSGSLYAATEDEVTVLDYPSLLNNNVTFGDNSNYKISGQSLQESNGNIYITRQEAIIESYSTLGSLILSISQKAPKAYTTMYAQGDLVYAVTDKSVEEWDAKAGYVKSSAVIGDKPVFTSKWIVAISDETHFTVFNRSSLESVITVNTTETLSCVYLIDDTVFYALGKSVYSYDIHSQESSFVVTTTLQKSIIAMVHNVNNFYFSDGNYMQKWLIGSNSIRTYEAYTGVPLLTDIVFTAPDGVGDVFTSHIDGNIYKYDRSNGEIVSTLNVDSAPVLCLFSTSDRLYSCQGRSILEWNLARNEVIRQYGPHSDFTVGVSVIGNTIFSVSRDGTVSRFAMNAKVKVSEFDQRPSVSSLAKNDKYFVAGHGNGLVSFYDRSSRELIRSLRAGLSLVISVTLQGENLITCDSFGMIKKWNSNTGALLDTIDNLNVGVEAVYALEDKLFIARTDGQVSAVLTTDNSMFMIYSGQSGAVHAVFASENQLYTGGEDQIIKGWDIESGETKAEFIGHTGAITSLYFDGVYLYSGSSDTLIKRWNTATTSVINNYSRNGHFGSVTALAVCGNHLISGGEDTIIFQWILTADTPLHRFTGHSETVTSIQCTPSMEFVSSCLDENLILWNVYVPPSTVKPGVTEIYIDESTINPTSTVIGERTLIPQNDTLNTAIIGAAAGAAAVLVLCLGFGYWRYKKINQKVLDLEEKQEAIKKKKEAKRPKDVRIAFNNINLDPPENALVSLDFEFKKELGKGGIYTLHVGEGKTEKTQKYGKEVMVKKLADAFQMAEDKFKYPFVEELAALNLLRQEKHIAKLIGFCETPCCLVLKYYQQGSLNFWIHGKKPLTKSIVLHMVSDIAKGIEAIHRANIAHCDIKLQNISVDVDPSPRKFSLVIAEFGNARLLMPEHEEAAIKQKFRSPNLASGSSARYASPEAFDRYHAKKYGDNVKQTDLYSFACVIYEILHRKLPWN
jgi:hypothetical protein